MPPCSSSAAGAKGIGCDSSYLTLPILAMLAAGIGNMPRIQLKLGWNAPAILWVAIVGESGTAKTPAFKLVLRLIRERQRKTLECYDEAMKKYEVELARYANALPEWWRERKTSCDPHPGKETRKIPLFPELREHLEASFDPQAKYVVDERMRASAQGKDGWRGCNLRTQFERIIKKAGLTAWPRLFHNLRSSRQTELAEVFPSRRLRLVGE